VAELLPTDIPANFRFPDYAPLDVNDAVLAPRQTFVISRVVANRLADDELAAVMQGDQRRLFFGEGDLRGYI
jgi:hypothetical protein